MNSSEDRFYRLNNNLQFQKLPKFVQENIKQSGISVDSPEHLEQICHHMVNDTEE